VLIKDIYHQNPVTISSDLTVKEALQEINNKRINGLIVTDKKNPKKVIGVLAIQDIAAATVPRQFKKNLGMAAAMYKKGFFHEMCDEIKDQPVTKIMRKNFEWVSLDDHILAITAEFLRGDLYLVPVIENKELVGVVTRSEIKKALLFGMGITS
jgi:predicted transcriptional regulator